MANTYTQIYIQVVFAVEARQNLVRPEWKEEFHITFLTEFSALARPARKLRSLPLVPQATKDAALDSYRATASTTPEYSNA